MNKTISLLILASAALHLLVLGLTDLDTPADVITAGSQMRISIQASSPASIKTPPAKPFKQHQATIVKTQAKISAIAKKKTLTQENINTPVRKKTSSTQNIVIASLQESINPSASELPKSISSLLYSKLESAFALNFYYPRIAVKRGWQGEVKISLRVEADGHLTRVRILNSSGHNILDKAAMASIDKVEILPSAIALLDGQTLDLILPVEYRLL